MSSSLHRHVIRQAPTIQSEEDFISLAQCNVGFIYLIPVLIGAVQLCLQGKDKSPLETHPANIYTFLLATSIYCFAQYKIRHTTNSSDQTNYSQLSEIIAFISGSLSSVSLVSIIIPRWFGYMFFISWGFVSGFVVYANATVIKKTCRLLLQKIEDTWLYKKFCDNISSLYGAIRIYFEADSTLRPDRV